MKQQDYLDTIHKYVKDNKGLVGASKQSQIDIERVGYQSNGKFKLGKMYSFRYYTPDEPKYDTYPLILSLGPSIDGHQLGLNLHYLPYNIKTDFLSRIIKSYSTFFTRQISGNIIKNPKYQPGLSGFNYNSLNEAFGRKYNFKHGIHQYNLNRIRMPVIIGYENWHLGALNNQNYFIGTNINEAQSLYFS